jgi:hypothetical protein
MAKMQVALKHSDGGRNLMFPSPRDLIKETILGDFDVNVETIESKNERDMVG